MLLEGPESGLTEARIAVALKAAFEKHTVVLPLTSWRITEVTSRSRSLVNSVRRVCRKPGKDDITALTFIRLGKYHEKFFQGAD
jgi:hypothetical protein